MDLVEAKAKLGLEETFTFGQLKKAYRVFAMFMHPDRGGTEENFNEIQTAFDLLQNHCSDSEDREKSEVTIGGKPLSEFGNGYPITESAKICDNCEGRGYKEFKESTNMISVNCPDCKGDGAFWVPCKKCGGDGKYGSRGTCFLCNGTGKFYPPYKQSSFNRGNPFFGFMDSVMPMSRSIKTKDGVKWIKVNRCKHCTGHGIVDMPNPDKFHKYYLACDDCGGVGEVKMWNPVIPRGLMK